MKSSRYRTRSEDDRMPSVKSPWASTFDQFVGSIQESAIIAVPFITRHPVERLVQQLHSCQSVRLDLLTNLDERSLSDGLVDSAALSWLCQQVPKTTVRHLRYLHAKAYIADNHTAIVTSANLTNGGLYRNYELGVKITDPQEVADISSDLQEYGEFGVLVPADALSELDGMAQEAQGHKENLSGAAKTGGNSEYNEALDRISERLAELRTDTEEFAIDPTASITAKFADAVKYVLKRNGPLPTAEIHPLIQELMPEWCDDNVERIIKGASFGRKWKHQVRNAQVQLRREGVIVLEEGRWRLV